jgi:hypothetical protein
MSFFGRTLVVFAVAAGIAHVFRKDLLRLVSAVRKPAATFIQDLKKELEVSPAKSSTAAEVSANSPPSDISKQAIAAAAEVRSEAAGVPSAKKTEASKLE